jgi:hypothetical protein
MYTFYIDITFYGIYFGYIYLYRQVCLNVKHFNPIKPGGGRIPPPPLGIIADSWQTLLISGSYYVL